MARTRGSARLAASLEVEAGAPLDARTVVPTRADLLRDDTFPYKYIGMIVSVQSEGKAYILNGTDPTVEANWTPVGSGEGGDIEPMTPEELEALEESFTPNEMNIPTYITPEELEELKDAFVPNEPILPPIPEVMTGEDLEFLMDTYNPIPFHIEPLSPDDLQDIKDAFVIN